MTWDQRFDYRPSTSFTQKDTFKVRTQLDSGVTYEVRWPSGLSSFFRPPLVLRYFNGTRYTDVDMLTNTIVNYAHLGEADTITIFSLGGSTFLVPLAAGWNIVCNPVETIDDTVRHLYPTAMFNYAYRFVPTGPGAGYRTDIRMENGVGYWEKFGAAFTQRFSGLPLASDSIRVATGWNMVGSIGYNVDTSTIVSIPPGLRISSWYAYVGGFTIAPKLTAGQGYWVRSNASGLFVLTGSSDVSPAQAQTPGWNPADELNTLSITDTKGGLQKLCFGEGDEQKFPVSTYVLPPRPPEGAFDARFETSDGGSMVQTHGDSFDRTVSIQAYDYPLTVSWKIKNGEYQITSGGRTVAVSGDGSMKITDSEVNRMKIKLIGAASSPTECMLHANYPNPFNPSTTINYGLSGNTHVALKIFNILGQEVATLVDEVQKAGYKSVEWNAGSFASGVYFYRLRAGDFVQTKKLLLLK